MKRWLPAFATVWIISHLILFIVLPVFIPYLGFFPYKETATQYHLPAFITALANFDGVHYLGIAKNGYSQYEQAFFPLFPLSIFAAGFITFGNLLLAATFISFFSFFIGLYVFSKYIKEIVLFSKSTRWLSSWSWALLLLVLFPTSFYFTAIYTEGLFLLFTTLSLYFLKKQRYFLTGICIFLSSLTRLVGFFLIIPVLIHIWQKLQRQPIKLFLRENFIVFFAFFAPIIGLISYCFYLWKTTGDPIFFLHAQSAFGAQRSSKMLVFPIAIYRYIKIFLTAQWNFQYFISAVEFITFIFFLAVLSYELHKILKNRSHSTFYDRLGLNLFSFANLLLPSFTGTFSSMPRYVLFSLSFFIALGELKNKYIKILLIIVFSILHVLLFGFFIQGYFVS